MKAILNNMNRRDILRTTTAAVASSIGADLMPRVAAAESPRGSRISYCCDGKIYVNEPASPEGNPLTTGHTDFKPSWSKADYRYPHGEAAPC
jgi:hypothetical protein